MSNDDPLIRRYASGCLNNIATHRLKITQMSDEALAAVKLRVETKEIEERRSRYAMDTIALAVRAMPLAARERRVAMAKRRLASALRVLSAEFRHERMMRAEEKAARLPAIMTVPLILFILPTLFVVILGPAACSISAAF